VEAEVVGPEDVDGVDGVEDAGGVAGDVEVAGDRVLTGVVGAAGEPTLAGGGAASAATRRQRSTWRL